MAGRGTRRWRLVRAPREAVPTSVRRHTQTEKPRTLKLGRAFWLATAAAALLGVLAWILFGTTLLSVRQVVVTGSVIAGPDAVRLTAAIADGTPLARVDTDAVAQRVQSLPSVAAVEVSRSWPSTIVIEVTERSAVAVVKSGDSFLILDGTGTVFNTVASQPKGLALLRVSAVGPNDPATAAALRVLAALTPQLRSQLKEIIAPSATQIHLLLTSGLTVIWGDADQSETKAQVATALLDRATKHIDVSSPDVAAAQ